MIFVVGFILLYMICHPIISFQCCIGAPSISNNNPIPKVWASMQRNRNRGGLVNGPQLDSRTGLEDISDGSWEKREGQGSCQGTPNSI